MGEQQQDIWMEDAVRSYVSWWHEAGLHSATDHEPHRWRGEQPAPFWRQAARRRPAEARAEMVEPSAAPPTSPLSAPTGARAMPDSLPAFLDWLAHDSGQPEAGWDGPTILPSPQPARLTVIVEMPAPEATDVASLLDAAQQRFISAMLASLDVPASDTMLVAMATRRPPGGVLDEEALARLAGRMTYYLGLAQPQAALILGDRSSRALLGADWNPRAPGLPLFKHTGGTVRAAALASPELLMHRPMAKARSWQALRLLHEDLNK